MRSLQLFLLSLLLSLVTSCLVIQYPVTTTPQCGCQFTILNKTNHATHLPLFLHPFYDGPWFQPIQDPMTSGDECFRSLSCPSNYNLILTRDQDYQTYPDVELSAICDPYSQQWLVDDGVHEIETFDYIEVTCVRFKVCPCFGGSIDIPGFWAELMKNGFYGNNLTHHPIQVGTITYSEDNCATNITCPDGWTAVKLGAGEGDLLESCKPDWINSWYGLQHRYWLCADFRTVLN